MKESLPSPHYLSKNNRSYGFWLFLLLSFLLSKVASAQTITSLSPARNALSADRSTNVAVTASAGLNSSNAIKVFSPQAGGNKAGNATANGNTLSFNPTADFKPGETVFTTVTAASGLTKHHVFQFTTAAASASGTFTGSIEMEVGDTPTSVAAADVDGDGDLDILAANAGSNSVSVRINNGSGSFGGGYNVAVDAVPYSVAAADVDGDGDLDILAANSNSNSVSVRINNGSGSFSGGSNVAVGSSPTSVAAADVDGDGDLDILAANAGSNTVSVRMNNGSGSFGGGSNLPVESQPTSVAAADVDGDLDILAANSNSNSVSVRINNGSGSFGGGSNVAVDAVPYSVAAADVDGDGDLDILAANAYSNSVSVRLNQAATTTITSITRVSASPTNASTVSYTVTFAAAVTGVDASDFALTKTGTATGIIGTPTGSGTTWTVPVTSATGDGTLRLDFTGLTGVTPNVSAAYTSGQYYTLDNTAPTVTGVDNNGKYNTDKTMTLEADATATLNGASFTSGTEVSEEGDFTLIATDAAGNTITLVFTIDKTAPVVSGVTANVLYTTNPTITYNEGSATLNGSAFTSGSTVSTDASYVLIVTDEAGNSTTINFILDKTAPVISGVPTQAIVVATPNNSCETTITFPEITASDNLSSPGDITLKYTIAGNEITNGNLFKVGNTEVKVLATDQAGNFKTAVFTVTVQDKTLPVITPPAAITQANDAGKCGAAVSVSASATDNCSVGTPIGVRSDGKPLNAVYPVGTTIITWNVSDANGNAAVPVTQTVTITDSEAPKAFAKNMTIQLNNAGTAAISAEQVNNNSTDNCGIKSTELSKTQFSCQNVGANTVILTVTDIHGNVSTAEATITVEDKIQPSALAKNMTVYLDASGNASITPEQLNNGSNDVCGTVQLTLSKTNFTCSNVGANEVTLTVTDQAGNKATATAIVTVIDDIKPLAQAQNITVTLVNGLVTVAAADVNNGSSDNCGIKSLVLDKTSFTCANIGANTVTLTVTDNSGNISRSMATVTVIGTIPTPAITVIPTSTVYTGGNPTIIYLGYGAQSVKLQASGGVKYSWSPATGLSKTNIADPVFTPTSAGTYTFTVTATNSSGCTATSTITITVIDAQYGNKKNQVIICHGGKSNNIDVISVPDHLAHGDYLGNCTSTVPAITSSRSYAVETEVALQPVLKSYPNPFSGQTTIEFSLTQDEEYTLTIYDLKGTLVKQLPGGKAKANELKQVAWQVGNAAAGLYIVRLTTATSVQQLKLLVE